jgi:hypothetical protein
MRYVNQWSYIVQTENYFVTYIGSMSTVWINKDILTNNSDSFNFSYLSFVKHAVYNPFKAELYHFVQLISTNGTSNYIEINQLNFNCSLANNNNKKSFPLSTDCDCSSMQVFNRSTAMCASSTCGYKNGPTCVCPPNFIFDSFNQNCRLDCSTFKNSLLTLPFNSNQCLCQYPYSWKNSQIGCVLNCRRIP